MSHTIRAEYLRGHLVFQDTDGKWYYADTRENVKKTPRPCKRCGAHFPLGKVDPCLGKLRGVKFACCGHGVSQQAYIVFDNGLRIEGFEIDP